MRNLLAALVAARVVLAASPSSAAPAAAAPEPIVPESMCLTLLVRDGLGLPTVKAHHQPVAVKIALPRHLERLADIDLVRLGLPPGAFLDSARLAPYSVASGALMPLRTGGTSLSFGKVTTESEKRFLGELSELLSRNFAVSMGASSLLGQGLTVSPVVNTFTGNLFVCSLDAVALWKGLNVMLYRVHNGLRRGPGPFGPGWTHNFDCRLDAEEDAGTQYTRWDGSGFCYKPDGKGGYLSPDGFNDFMTRSGTGHVITDESGFFLSFNAGGRLAEIGNRLPFRIQLEYENDRLKTVRNMRLTRGLLPGLELKPGQDVPVETLKGPGVFLSYDEQSRIRQVRSTSGSQMDYAYNARGRLERVSSNTGQAVEYRYDNDGRLAEIRNPLAGTGSPKVLASVLYDALDRVSLITDETGNPLMRLSYRWAEDRTTQIELGVQKLLVTDVYDARGVLIERVETDQSFDIATAGSTGSKRQTRACDADLNVTSVHRHDGTNTRWFYDGSGNMERAQDSSGEWVEMTYDRRLGLMDYIRESGGRWLRIVYAADGEMREIALDYGARYKVGYDDGGIPRELVNASGDSVPLEMGLPPEVPKQLWEF